MIRLQVNKTTRLQDYKTTRLGAAVTSGALFFRQQTTDNGFWDFRNLGIRGAEGLEGLEFFSTEKTFRVVSCGFVDGGIQEFRIFGFRGTEGLEGLEFFQRKKHFV